MGDGLKFGACLFLGIAGGVAGGVLTRREEGPPPPPPEPLAPAPRGPSPADLDRRIAGLEEKVAALKAEARPPAAAAAPPNAAAPVAPAAVTEERVAALEKRLADLEKTSGRLLPAELAKKSVEELKALAQEVSRGGQDFGAAVKVYEELLKRDLPDNEKRDMQFQLGYGYRALQDHAKEEAVFRDLLQRLPPESPEGVNALFQVAWARFYQKDNKEAGVLMERLAGTPSATAVMRAQGVFRTGQFAFVEKDYTRARPWLEKLLKEEGPTVIESQKWILDEARRMLKEMDGQ
jgi:tetratricopeptide (TPR) repeat protein